MSPSIIALSLFLSPLVSLDETEFARSGSSATEMPVQVLPKVSETFYQSLSKGIIEAPYSGSAIKLERVKKSRSTGTRNEIGSGMLMTSVDAAMPVSKVGFSGFVRRHVDSLIDAWYGKKSPGKLTVSVPLIQSDFCSVQVERYFDAGSPSMSSLQVEGYLLVWDGAKAVKKGVSSMVRPGLWPGVLQLMRRQDWVRRVDGGEFSEGHNLEWYRTSILGPASLRALFDPDGRGRHVVAEISYRELAEFVIPNSPLAKYLSARRFDQLPAPQGPSFEPQFDQPSAVKSYKTPQFSTHSLRISPTLAATAVGKIITDARSEEIPPTAFVSSLQLRAGTLDLAPGIDRKSWSTLSDDSGRTFRTSVGYIFEGKHPHKGARTCLYRMRDSGPEGPILVSNREFLDWTVASDAKDRSVAVFALVSDLKREHQEGDFTDPLFLVKFDYNGSTFRKAGVWSLKDLGVNLQSPAEVRAQDINRDGVDEVVLISGHGGDFGYTDSVTLSMAAGKPLTKQLGPAGAMGYLQKRKQLQHYHGPLSEGGPILLTVVEKQSEGDIPYLVLLDDTGRVKKLVQGQGLLVDDLDQDGDLDVLVREGGFFSEGRLVWLEQHE